MKSSSEMLREAWEAIYTAPAPPFPHAIQFPIYSELEGELLETERKAYAEPFPFSTKPVTLKVSDVGIKQTVTDVLGGYGLSDRVNDWRRQETEDAIFAPNLLRSLQHKAVLQGAPPSKRRWWQR